MLFSDSRDSRFVPRQFRFPIWRRENGAEWQGSSGKGGRCSIFRTFYHHRAYNDRSVFFQCLTILFSVAGISHSRGGGGTSLKEADGDAPLGGVAFSPLD